MTPFTTILTHPGSAHKDEFLACCVLLATAPGPILRREPTEADLADPATAVVDVGHRHEPALNNFDHHQLPADAAPTCALSLVLQHLGLYADAVLQLFYLALSAYGWYEWMYGGARHTRLKVSRATRMNWMVVTPLFLAGGIGLGAVLARYTDSPMPYFDALLTSASLVAQWMMTRKLLENWVIWILADLVYVPVFIMRGLPLTALQYAIFLVLAAIGYVGWRQSLRMTTAEGVAA